MLVLTAGDVCIMYSFEEQAPLELLLNITACSCYSLCNDREECGWRKHCPASLKRLACKASPRVAYDSADPCPRQALV